MLGAEGGDAAPALGVAAPRAPAREKARTPIAAPSPSVPSSAASPPAHTLEVRIGPARIDAETFALYKRYQMVIHKDSSDEVTPSRYKSFLVQDPFVVRRA